MLKVADHLIAQRDLILAGKRASLEEPPVRCDLSPTGMYTRGAPRIP